MTISKRILSKMAFATLIISTLLGALALRAGGDQEENTQQERVEQEQSMPEGTIVDIHGFGALAQDEIELAREQGWVDPRDQEIAKLKEEIERRKDFFDKHETMMVDDNFRFAVTQVALGMAIGAVAGYEKNGVPGAFAYGFVGYTVAGFMHGLDFAINAEKLRPHNQKRYYRAAAILTGPALTILAAQTLRDMGNLIVSEAGLAKKWAMDWLTRNCSSKGE